MQRLGRGHRKFDANPFSFHLRMKLAVRGDSSVVKKVRSWPVATTRLAYYRDILENLGLCAVRHRRLFSHN